MYFHVGKGVYTAASYVRIVERQEVAVYEISIS